jgi:hypothetical protein
MKRRKGDRVTYLNASGWKYSAVVQRAHRDGTVTVQLQFPLDRNGKEMQNCFQGDHWRVGPKNILDEAKP